MKISGLTPLLLIFILFGFSITLFGQNNTNTPVKIQISVTYFSMEKCIAIYTNYLTAAAISRNHGDGGESSSGWEGTPIEKACQEIISNKMAMAYFTCEKVANSNYTNSDGTILWGRLYEDVGLLKGTAGIDLSKPRTMDHVLRFAQEWHAGVYKDPGKQIAEICDLLAKNHEINYFDLRPLLHYGLFGIFELKEQIINTNSKPAFVAYLIIANHEVTGLRNLYDDPNNSRFAFASKEAKLDYIKGLIDESQVKAISKYPPLNSNIIAEINAAALKITNKIPVSINPRDNMPYDEMP